MAREYLKFTNPLARSVILMRHRVLGLKPVVRAQR
jgi:hypothetical protein